MTQDTLDRLLSEFDHCQVDDSADFPRRWLVPLESLLAYARDITPEQSDVIFTDNPGLASWQPRLFRLYARYIRMHEIREVTQNSPGKSSKHKGDILAEMGDFAHQSYDRVRDMFDRIDFSGCHRFVMVGCGALPVTMLNILNKTGVPHIIGLDIDATALDLNKAILVTANEPRLQMVCSDGCDYNYRDADVIYIANLVSPKAGVLGRVADTAGRHTPVILRDPYAMGRLFTEAGADCLDARYTVLSEGDGDHRFLSRHVFLELNNGL